MTEHPIELSVNGQAHQLSVPARMSLADALRERLDLTGTHLGCEHGVCGACTVIIDGSPGRSCLVFAVQANGAQIRTIEGLAAPDQLDPIQAAFTEHHGMQCGFCTPGFVMSLVALLENNQAPTQDELNEMLEGVLCRCTGYVNIRRAAETAVAYFAEQRRYDE